MCQQCQATLRKGHISIFLVCFSVDVPEALGLCCWSEPAGAGQRAGTLVTPRQGQRTVPGARARQKAPQSCPSRGQQRFPPCTHLPGRRGIHTGRGFRGAQSQTPVGLFTWRFYSPTELPDCVSPRFPHHTFLSLYHFLLTRILFITENFLDWLLHFLTSFNKNGAGRPH